MRTIIVLAMVLPAVMSLVAETETVGDYTWKYSINGDMVELQFGVSPEPTGIVVIPSSLGGKPVTSIGRSVFDSCDGLAGVTIPNSVTNIGESAFSHCSGLTSVTIPESVISIGYGAFYNCENLTNIVVNAGTISNCAFSWCGTAPWNFYRIPLSLTIGESVTNIGEQAFSFCYGLCDLTIPANVATIGLNAFGDVGVTNLFIDVEYVGGDGRIFSQCGDAATLTVVLGDGVKHVGDGFLSQNRIDSLTIGKNVETIGESAFERCWGLKEVTIPNSVRDIGAYAFTSDFGTDLTKITLGCGVTNIGAYAFAGNHGVTGLTIPESVQDIGDYAFSHCASLTNVVFDGNAPTIGAGCFFSDMADMSCTGYVRRSSTGWGVEIPGVWNGINIQYMTPEMEIATWLTSFGFAANDLMANGRTAAECYALGLDPSLATNDFRIVSIKLVDGKPKVEWEPKTNRWTGAEIQAVLKGAATLDGEWKAVEGATAVEKAAMRFFKVVVVP